MRKGSDEESNSDIEDLREVIIKTIFRNQKADKFLSRNHFKPEEVPTATFFLYLKTSQEIRSKSRMVLAPRVYRHSSDVSHLQRRPHQGGWYPPVPT